jgi:DUF971 family protein
MAAPTEIRLNKLERLLHVQFDDASRYSLPADTEGRAPAPKCRAMGRTRSRPFPASSM